MIVPADVNHPESKEVLVSNWEPAPSLVEDAVSRAEVAPFGTGCRLIASLPPAGDGPVTSLLALLWYSLSPLFCEPAGSVLSLGLFVG